jgi:hypothetical protein
MTACLPSLLTTCKRHQAVVTPVDIAAVDNLGILWNICPSMPDWPQPPVLFTLAQLVLSEHNQCGTLPSFLPQFASYFAVCDLPVNPVRSTAALGRLNVGTALFCNFIFCVFCVCYRVWKPALIKKMVQ